MNTRKAEAGEILFREGEQNHLISIVVEGKVGLQSQHIQTTVEKGHILGVPEANAVFYPFTCTAQTPVTLYQYDYQAYDDLNAMLSSNLDACALIACYYAMDLKEPVSAHVNVISSCRVLYDTIREEYEQYKALCAKMQVEPKQLPGLDQLSDFSSKAEFDEWIGDYYTSIDEFGAAKWKAFYEKDVKACAGIIIRAGADLKVLLSSIHTLSMV